MTKEKIKFVIPLPFTTDISKFLIHKHQKNLSNPLNSFTLGGKVLFYSKDKIDIEGIKFAAHLYSDERRKVEEIENFLKKIIELEDKVKESKFKSGNAVKEYLEETLKGWSKFFKISTRKGKIKIIRKEDCLREAIEQMGKSIIISNDYQLDKKNTLWLYRKRYLIESIFDILKNDLKDKRLRTHSLETSKGKLFLSFLSLILHSGVCKIMREKDIFKDYTLIELLYELKKIKIVEMENGKIFLTEISKKQKDILKKFDLPIPEI